jgi:nickel/cobalt transporter (NicO) family protein
MSSSSLWLLLGAAVVVAVLHSLLPDHWVPLAIVARTQRWSLWRVGRVTFLASLGHVVTSLVLGGILALIGLQFQKEFETQQGHIIGVVLILTGIIFLIWGLVGNGPHGHTHEGSHDHDDDHDHDHDHPHNDEKAVKEQTKAKGLAAIIVPFGVAASPDLTILPVALAASAVGTGAVVVVLSVFAVVTIVTFVGLTVIATLAGYQIKGKWLENNANTITSLVLIAIGIVAFIGL